MTDEELQNEMASIYLLSLRVGWKKKRGNGYYNMYRGTADDPLQVVSRSLDVKELNENPILMGQIMQSLGLTGKTNVDFHVIEVFDSVDLGKSFHYTA